MRKKSKQNRIKKAFFGCLIIIAIPIIALSLVIGYTVLFPKKPATEETIKKVLLTEFDDIRNSGKLNKKVEAFKFLQKNRTVILDSLRTTNTNNSHVLLDLKYYKQGEPHLPKTIVHKLSNIIPLYNYKLEITKDEKFNLINRDTDYKNCLYLVHSLNKIDTLSLNNKFGNHTKTLIIEDVFQYRLTIEDAFNDIDPNNFSPN